MIRTGNWGLNKKGLNFPLNFRGDSMDMRDLYSDYFHFSKQVRNSRIV
ncbi:hypothetical protein LLB_1785 [Legionella longbeachae D-4968]|nr:hypothetical protein LLB_1785 [Legionella longbeachae D-4968]